MSLSTLWVVVRGGRLVTFCAQKRTLASTFDYFWHRGSSFLNADVLRGSGEMRRGSQAHDIHVAVNKISKFVFTAGRFRGPKDSAHLSVASANLCVK
jgi:hypothetical protein